MATYMDGMDGGKHNSDDAIGSFTPKQQDLYVVTYRGFTEQNGLITEDVYYQVFAHSEEDAVSVVENINETSENPLYDIKIISVEKLIKE